MLEATETKKKRFYLKFNEEITFLFYYLENNVDLPNDSEISST